MRKITLFIAMSLDGFIADKNGSIHWLRGQDTHGDDMISYRTFIKDIDMVVMGWNTYHQITEELSPDAWMYPDLNTVVMTHRTISPKDKIAFYNCSVCDLVNQLKQEKGKGIWICGGAGVIAPLMKAMLIDEFHISIIPTILGNGIRLFSKTDMEQRLRLKRSYSYHGITDVVYSYRSENVNIIKTGVK